MTEEQPLEAAADAVVPDATVSAHGSGERLSTRAAASKARARANDPSAATYTADEKHFLHEVLTMALYVSLSLLAVLIASPDVTATDHRVEQGLIVLGTGLALVLAHFVAFRMSTRLVNEGRLTPQSRDLMKAQALGGLPVALLASLPVFVLGEDPGEAVAELLLLLFVLWVGYRTARYSTNRLRSLLYVVAIFVLTTFVVLLKLLVGH